MRFRYLTLLLLLTATPLSHLSAACKWPAFIDFRGDFGNKRTIGRSSLFVPVLGGKQALLFGYARGLWDTDHNQEGDFGIGLRKAGCSSVVGCYGFYDLRRTENHHLFHEMTLGLEGYTRYFEARVNGYVPFSSSRLISGSGFAEGVIEGDQVLIVGHRENLENALYGVDAEIGVRVLCWPCLELRGLVGGYYFERKGYPSFQGPRGRAELSWRGLPFLGEGSALTLGIEGQYDNIRAGRIFGIVRLDIPLAFGRERRCRLNPCRLDARMTHRIERLDLVTATRRGAPCEDIALFKGRPFKNVVTINANTANVPLAVANAGPDSLVVVDGSLGPILTDDTVLMNDRQVLAGGLASLPVEGITCGPAQLIIPGAPPTVLRETNTGPVIAMADESTVDGLRISGGNLGVLVEAVRDVMFMNSRVIQLVEPAPGIQITSGSLRANVTGNRILTTGDGAYGIRVEQLSNEALIAKTSICTQGVGATALEIEESADVIAQGNALSTEGALARGIHVMSAPRVCLQENDIDIRQGTEGVFVELSDEPSILKNRITVLGAGGTGVLISGSDGATVLQNCITTIRANSPGIRVNQGSQDARVVCNLIATSGDGDSPAIWFEGDIPITSGRILSNSLLTTGDRLLGTIGPAGIALTPDLENFLLKDNVIDTQGDGASGILLEGARVVTVSTNCIHTAGEGSHGVHLREGNFSIELLKNEITTGGDEARGILARNTVDPTALKGYRLEDNDVTTSGTGAHAVEFDDFLDGVFLNNGLMTSGPKSDDARVGQTSDNAAAGYLFEENRMRATGFGSNGLASENTNNGTGLEANKNAFFSIANFVILLDSSRVSGEDNTWNEQGGGSLCSASGANIGEIAFSEPEGGTCP